MNRTEKIRKRSLNTDDQQYFEDTYFLLQKIDRMQDAFARIVAMTPLNDCELQQMLRQAALDGGFEAGVIA